MTDADGLLTAVRVLDLGDPTAAAVSRVFADLGAEVIKVEPPGGDPGRSASPAVVGHSLSYAIDNANKRSVILDPTSAVDRVQYAALLAGADILVDSGRPGRSAEFGLPVTELGDRFPLLVTLWINDFGADGPRAAWRATDQVLYSMSTVLSRSGPTVGTPVLPPSGIASATAAVQAAWAALVAYYHRMHCGVGDLVDFSRFEGVVQALDPPFGSEGQAAAGRKPSGQIWRGRPRNQSVYPIFACKDGFVRICLLAARQWRGMHSWLGAPAEFSDPRFDSIAGRYSAAQGINALIAALFADQTRDELVTQGQVHGVPVAAVLSPAETLNSEHFREVGALTDVEIAPGAPVPVSVGPFVVDGQHRGLARGAPQPGADKPKWPGRPEKKRRAGADGRPLAGVRILDLGVIVAGGELGRLFADLGADVIKVESPHYPDGLRQTPPGQIMSRSWALTHRNESSLGLDLRHPSGRTLFAQMVRGADAVFANFKPGTLASLGFDYDTLRNLNPRIVLAESSAFGDTGPWNTRMGYGPLVRASTGVTCLWTSPDGGFFDATTVFPDHIVARVTAFAALAALIRRDATGQGARVHVSQAEVALSQLATTYAAAAARAAGYAVTDDQTVHGTYPCAGDDEWCVISLRDGPDREALATALGVSSLPTQPPELTTLLSAWTSTRYKEAVAEQLQRLGIAAGPMQRAADVLADPQLVHRQLYTEMHHPLFEAPMPTEAAPARYRRIGPTALTPAPLAGQHTREICDRVLGLGAAETNRLIADGVLFSADQTHQ